MEVYKILYAHPLNSFFSSLKGEEGISSPSKVCGFKSPAKSMKYDGITSLRSGVSQSFIFCLMLRVLLFFLMNFVIFEGTSEC